MCAAIQHNAAHACMPAALAEPPLRPAPPPTHAALLRHVRGQRIPPRFDGIQLLHMLLPAMLRSVKRKQNVVEQGKGTAP